MSSTPASQVIDGVQCIWLQGIGWHGAKPIADIVVGDIVVYNYGGTARVDKISPSRTGGSITLTVTAAGGTSYECNPRRTTTLVAVKGVTNGSN